MRPHNVGADHGNAIVPANTPHWSMSRTAVPDAGPSTSTCGTANAAVAGAVPVNVTCTYEPVAVTVAEDVFPEMNDPSARRHVRCPYSPDDTDPEMSFTCADEVYCCPGVTAASPARASAHTH